MRTPPTGEMNEKNLVEVARIFLPEYEWAGQVKFHYDPSTKRKYYKTDCCSVSRKLVWEYEGPDHYEDVWKLRRDEEREKFFVREGYTFLRWPYYCQLTKDVAKHFFKKSFTEEKYKKAIETVYGVGSESSILSPGFHSTKNTPANYVAKGTRRFLAELDLLPFSLKAQVVHSLKLYTAATDDPYLVIGEGPEYQELLNIEIRKEYLNLYYARYLEEDLDGITGLSQVLIKKVIDQFPTRGSIRAAKIEKLIKRLGVDEPVAAEIKARFF